MDPNTSAVCSLGKSGCFQLCTNFVMQEKMGQAHWPIKHM